MIDRFLKQTPAFDGSSDLDNILVLGIETSCDEAGVAIYSPKKGVVAEALRSQIDLHANYGGVVPELASRDHVRHLIPLVDQVINQAGIKASDLTGIAYTAGPGLMGALFVGACVGRALAYAWKKPSVAIHHMEGHLLAPLLEDPAPAFPFVALLVSGGHTQLVRVDGWQQYRLLGTTLDDAAGEAFDKVARMLGLGYPGGPKVAACALQGNPNFKFPRPMVDRPGLDFSFSGLKTAVLNRIERCKAEQGYLSDQTKADIAAAFQEAVVQTLVIKCKRAIKETGINRLVLAGGVSANQLLRQKMAEELKAQTQIFYPRLKWCTDNGAMIAFAGAYHFKAAAEAPKEPQLCEKSVNLENQSLIQDAEHPQDHWSIKVYPRWPMCSS